MNAIESQPTPETTAPTSELVLMRLPSELLRELRLMCQATDRKLSEELRTGAAMRRDQLRQEPGMIQAVMDRELELSMLYSQFEQQQ